MRFFKKKILFFNIRNFFTIIICICKKYFVISHRNSVRKLTEHAAKLQIKIEIRK
jgi:hypothetical protein